MITVVVLAVTHCSSQDLCTAKGSDQIKSWTDMEKVCHDSISDQIHEEMTASITYLVMSAHFSGDQNYRPGVAKYFLDSAIEEREHAKKLMYYLLMRGGYIQNAAIKSLEPKTNTWKSMTEALQDALTLEKKVTANIKNIIKVCEGVKDNNDYHAVDYLTGDFLQEQYDGLRTLSGHLTTITRMNEQYGPLAEIVFDKSFA